MLLVRVLSKDPGPVVKDLKKAGFKVTYVS
jgi:hypothetical protein